ncbi:MAG: hypothetical protein GQE15_21145 [Archangiaceae bacterium]|nr:hypothetical protein [Archangiaceae bacterium]
MIFPIVCLIAAALYVLSIAPVAAAAEVLDLPRDSVKRVYAPVIWLHDHTPLRKPLEWYMALWGLH